MMRYKTSVANKLEAVKNSLDILMRGLEQKRYSPSEIIEIVKRAERDNSSAIELIDKEKDEIGI